MYTYPHLSNIALGGNALSLFNKPLLGRNCTKSFQYTFGSFTLFSPTLHLSTDSGHFSGLPIISGSHSTLPHGYFGHPRSFFSFVITRLQPGLGITAAHIGIGHIDGFVGGQPNFPLFVLQNSSTETPFEHARHFLVIALQHIRGRDGLSAFSFKSFTSARNASISSCKRLFSSSHCLSSVAIAPALLAPKRFLLIIF